MRTTDRSAGQRELAVTRRRLLEICGAGCLGLSLPRLLQARAEAAGKSLPRIKACIVLFYYGGPSQLETYDMKPQAPAEVRGEFQPIDSSVPGLQVCEHLPRMARVMHKVAVVRSMHHQMRLHDAACVETLTGRSPARGDGENFSIPNESDLFPSLGAAFAHVQRQPALPVTNAALPFVINNVIPVPCQTGGFLGPGCNPFQIYGDPDTLAYRAETLAMPEGLTLDRVATRSVLLREFDQVTHLDSTSNVGAPFRAHYQKAFDLLESAEVRRALDIDQEDDATRDRYGRGPRGQSFLDGPTGANGAELGIARNMRGQNLLLARRLVEAGVPFVNVFDFKQQGKNWDAHTRNFSQHKEQLLPPADQALSALIEDLDQRGLLETTLVVALGEFGRTPRINKDAGRDHWPDCYSAILAGGGVQGGAVYGASDKQAAYPELDPVSPGDLAATLFWRFGIDPATEIRNAQGRPFRLADGKPIERLFG